MTTKNGRPRAARACRVVVLPVGPEDARPLETLLRGTREACVRYYGALREEGPLAYEGRTLAVLDGFGVPVYAA